ncbi:autotransporter outer membrane beta-barrel domain-containing protein [Variovorax sp. E3]|uniref:autotransporter outer membrane beta-barrel domain-containing protein n=1 Tax=Variovorax sp. E3 TaxID=1914993 RepID=UPI0027DADABF|nr:autotransporter outer membrane beta-barrel domain-containing protein [Variovorax sp. E3]
MLVPVGVAVTITNGGTIAGGNGGTGVTVTNMAPLGGMGGNGEGGALGGTALGVPAQGGAGIVGGGLTIINTGTISGGLAGDGITRAHSLDLAGGGNTVTLGAGSVLNGSAVAQGSGNTLNLQGTNTEDDDFRGFSAINVASGAKWTLSGAFVPAGNLAIDVGGKMSPSAELTMNGVISGAGALSMDGSGRLTLGASNTYTGGTSINGGTLNAAVSGALGTGAVSVAASAGLLFTGNADAGSLSISAAAGSTGVNGGFIQFADNSSAGSATLTTQKQGSIDFRGNATASNAVIENRGGETTIWFNANAGKATITNFAGGQTNFLDDGAAAQARLINETGGLVEFFDRATADQATVVNKAGGLVRISKMTTPGISIGSLEGAGNVILGNKALTTGGLNTSTEISGVISGAGGSIVKVGTGTLTLSGVNTYTGGTSINDGTVNAAVSGALGTGAVAVSAGGTLRFNGTADAGNLHITLAAPVGPPVAISNVEFNTRSSAGNATFVANTYSSVMFNHDSTAGNAVFENRGGDTTFVFNSTAGNARITNFADGAVYLWDFASAGHAIITNEAGGKIDMNYRSTADQATIVNKAGGEVHISRLLADGTAIGSLEGAGKVLLGAKALTTGGLNTSTEVSGVISGVGGSLVKVGTGALTLSGANTYTGGTALRQGRLNVGHNQALGTGALSMDDDTTLGFSADGLTIANAIKLTGQLDPVIDTGAFSGTLSGAITGGGFITKQGTGTLTLSGANTYTGATSVAQGTLKAGAVNTFSAASAHSVAAGATLDLAGFNQAVASLANSGTVSLLSQAAGTTLTVNGNYVGNNGVLKLGTALNGAGPSDRLVINGGTASGKTSVQIANVGGLGALTSGNGIEVVTAQNGAKTTAQTTKDAFSLAGGHVDAGAYEYRLYAADAGGAGENWYLRSSINAVTPGNPAGVPVITYRPEASLYAALPSQLRQGNLAMLGDVRKRVGDDDVKGAATTPTGSDRRAWARVLSTDIDIQQGGAVSPKSKGRLTGFQAGTDLLATPNWRAGIYVGQLDGDARVNGFASGIQNLGVGRNDLRSQYVGVYGTYTNDSGFYADAVVQSGRHRYTVEPNLSAGVAGKGNSLLGSIEVGQAFPLGGSGWTIEPQLQLIHQHMDLSNSAIVGAIAQPQADSGWIARAGVRVKGQVDTGMGTLQPYGRFNVYKTSSGADIARFVNGATTTDIAAPTGSTSTELAGGFTLALSQSTSLYGEIGKLWSSGGDAKVKSGINGSLGVRVKW